MVFTTDWWLKRAVKFALKRYLGSLLRNEVDLEQLDVQLGRGTLELRGALLDCAYLNERLASRQWEVTAGYIGCLRLVIPITALSTEACSLHLEDALLTVRQRPSAAAPDAPAGARQAPGAATPAESDGDAEAPGEGWPGWEEGGFGPAAITDGVASIAGGIGRILQRLRVQAADVTVRLELAGGAAAAPAPLAALHLEQLTYAGEGPEAGEQQPPAQGTRLRKAVRFSGLTLELAEAGGSCSGAGGSCSEAASDAGSLPVEPARLGAAGDGAAAGAGGDRGSDGFASVRSPSASPLAPACSSPDSAAGDWQHCSSAAAAAAGAGPPEQGAAACPDDTRHLLLCGRGGGGGCSGELRLQLSWGSSQQAQPSVVAELALQPLQVQLQPAHLPLLARAAASLSAQAQGPTETLPPPASRSILADLLLPDTTALAQDFLVQSWAADSRDPEAESQFYDAESFFGCPPSLANSSAAASFFSAASGAWEARAAMAASCHPQQQQQQDVGSMRLTVEAQQLGVLLLYAPAAAAASCQGSPARLALEVGDVSLACEPGGSFSLALHGLEAAEHLPRAESAAGRAWDAEALTQALRVPEALPPAAAPRPVPRCAGAADGMQVWPVLCLPGGRRAAGGSASCRLTCRQGSGGGGPCADARLRPASLWLGLPLFQRLHAFLEPLVLALATPAGSPAGRGAPAGAAAGEASSGVTRMLRSLMADLDALGPGQRQPRQTSGSRRPGGSGGAARLSLSLPQACAVLLPADRRQGDPIAALALDILGPAAPQQPTLTLSEAAGGCWDATASLARVKGFLVTEEALPRQRLAATALLEIAPTQAQARGGAAAAAGVSLGVRWQPQPAPRQGLASLAWDTLERRAQAADGAGSRGSRADAALELAELREAAAAAAPLSVAVRVPAVTAAVSQEDVAALARFAAPLLRWQAETAAATALALGYGLPLTSASPAVLELECGALSCELASFTQGWQVGGAGGCRFLLSTGELRAFAASGLEGRAASSAAALQLAGLQLRSAPGGPLLLSCPPEAACLDLRHTQRQLAAASLAAEAQGLACLEGLTGACEPGDPGFSWLPRLAAFFALPPGEAPPAAEPAGAATAPEPAAALQPATAPEAAAAAETAAAAAAAAASGCAWRVQLEQCALRDEPPAEQAGEPGAVAAALLLGSLAWEAPAGGGPQAVQLRDVSLLAARAAARPAGFQDPSQALDCARGPLPSQGYACLAQEAGCSLALRQAEGGTRETDLSNQRLHCALTPEALALARLLAARWGAALAPPPADAAPAAAEQLPPEPEDSRQGLTLLAQLDEEAFSCRPERSPQPPAPAGPPDPTLGEAGFWDADEAEALGGPPVLVEDFFPGRYRALGEGSGGGEETGVWYDDAGSGGESPGPAGPSLTEDYVRPPPPGYRPPSGQRCCLGQLPDGFPRPRSRLILRELRLDVSLCQAAPPEPGEAGPPPAAPRLQLQLRGLCLQLDAFDEDSAWASRLAVSLQDGRLTDCQPRPGAAPAWQTVFGRLEGPQSPPSACLLVAELECVRPDVGGSEELRLKAAALPLRLRLDQDVLAFLQAFFSPPQAEVAGQPPRDGLAGDASAAAAADDCGGAFFQRCELASLALVADYKPRRLDVAALRAGSLAEVANVTAWAGVRLRLPAVRVSGVQGWEALGALVAQRYLDELTSTQVHSIVRGIKPLQSVLRIGAAAGQLLAVPAEALWGPQSQPQQGGPQAAVPLSRQLRRRLTGLARAILAEMLGMSAGALGGIHLVLAGPSAAARSAAQPGDVAEGMRQAADRLSSGFEEMGAALRAPFATPEASGSTRGGGGGLKTTAVRALRATPGALAKPFGGGAAAARCALLGARNSLDPERAKR